MSFKCLIHLFLTSLTILILYGWVGKQDQRILELEDQHYCDMLRLWQADESLPPEERRGWPPYRGLEPCLP